MMQLPNLTTDNKDINMAYRMALATISANIIPFKDGILEEKAPCIIAGLGYCTPWTRDSSINTWNGCGLLCSDEAKNSLDSILRLKEEGYFISGEYWDSIIWVTGAWWLYLYTGDLDFLKRAYNAAVNTLKHFEETEFNKELNLFRGPACYGDGVAAYPDFYATHGKSGIIAFARECREYCIDTGVGIPMHTLSTNCLYYNAYILADKMAEILGEELRYSEKARALKKAINKEFWCEEKGTYLYIRDDFGNCDYQEGMGIAFVILFGVADEEKTKKVLENAYVSPHGITCVWPTFPRYLSHSDPLQQGRHSGTVWPHIQGFWADAAAKNGRIDLFENEFKNQTENAINSRDFAEIYLPTTGEAYGGIQEKVDGGGMRFWKSEPFQTWSATAYIRNLYFDLIGMEFTNEGVTFSPVKTKLAKDIRLDGLKYRNSELFIHITVSEAGEKAFKLNGEKANWFVPNSLNGKVFIEITL